MVVLALLWAATALDMHREPSSEETQPIEIKEVSNGMPAFLAGPVDLNRAGLQDLVSVPGIGPKTAARILRERSDRGPFASVDDLDRVRGVGRKRIEKWKAFLTVGKPVEPSGERR